VDAGSLGHDDVRKPRDKPVLSDDVGATETSPG
jgi:hypothetical protein